jgi:hypothetical protein
MLHRKTIVTIVFCLAVLLSAAQYQPGFVDSVLANKILRIPVYKQPSTSNESMFLPMGFGKSEILDTMGFYELRNAEILSVDLLFTDYPANLDLKPLNRRRFQNLCKLIPYALSNPNTRWQVIRQMDGYDKETASLMLHGFVINYRKPVTSELTKKEISLIQSVTPHKPDPPAPKNDKLRNWDAIPLTGGRPADRGMYLRRGIKDISRHKDRLTKKQQVGDTLVGITARKAVLEKIISERDKMVLPDQDSLYLLLAPPEDAALPVAIKPPPKPTTILPDSTVIQVFKRNRFKDMLLVADVTASMSPYTAQIVQWLSDESSEHNLRYLVCFNDGDGSQDVQKKTGKVGGVYGDYFKDVYQISELIQSTMAKGSGGDLQENNCEALLYAVNHCSQYGDLVLVADSWAPVRDLELLSQIKQPVRVIVCGSELGPHPDYVTIAVKTGGSLHYMQEDIGDLSRLKKGEKLIIKGRTYQMVNGKAILVLR